MKFPTRGRRTRRVDIGAKNLDLIGTVLVNGHKQLAGGEVHGFQRRVRGAIGGVGRQCCATGCREGQPCAIGRKAWAQPPRLGHAAVQIAGGAVVVDHKQAVFVGNDPKAIACAGEVHRAVHNAEVHDHQRDLLPAHLRDQGPCVGLCARPGTADLPLHADFGWHHHAAFDPGVVGGQRDSADGFIGTVDARLKVGGPVDLVACGNAIGAVERGRVRGCEDLPTQVQTAAIYALRPGCVAHQAQAQCSTDQRAPGLRKGWHQAVEVGSQRHGLYTS